MLLQFGQSISAHAATHDSTGGDAVTPASIGAAALTHVHAAGDITSGTLPLNRGGTAASSASGARSSLGLAISQPPFSFGTGWGDYDTSNYWQLQFYKSQFLVSCFGMVRRTSGTGSIIATLTTDRPLLPQLCVAWGYWGGAYTLCRVDVNRSGQVLLVHPTSAPSSIDFLGFQTIYRSTTG